MHTPTVRAPLLTNFLIGCVSQGAGKFQAIFFSSFKKYEKIVENRFLEFAGFYEGLKLD